MAGEPQPAQKKRRLPFKPPSRATSSTEPSTAGASKTQTKTKQTTAKSSSVASTSKPANQRKSASSSKRSRAESPPASDAASDSGSNVSNPIRERSLSQEPDYILAEIITNNANEDIAASDPKIPPKLLTRLLHYHFQNEKTKVAKDANDVVAKYVDVFVREAIARAAYERAETEEVGGGRDVGDGFLEVEDLEKMAPQLTMDF
ncbi:hypothetical protein N7462_006112 [Penicillium macrosclerotiorum]|uniref:uncharacterized protein n=1 Tax=Penicillium macrosclerotiorum TaxID=303699 RepID=UPI002546874F|nr:uncharacterized protein N7462_006112 [Penicillium macrosclerotiorum]KAJ5682947.1 hypothetical protein N7462_006112 [Penicillium macrosclerotiorum]